MIQNTVFFGDEFIPFRQLFDTSQTVTLPASGRYRICAVGKGGDGKTYTDDGYSSGDYQFDMENGYCGGCGYVDVELSLTDVIEVTINSSYSRVTVNGSMLISATAGKNSLSGNSGTVQLGSSIPIIQQEMASSNANHSISIIPPTIYNDYISLGGEPGYYNIYRDTDFMQGENPGGNGLFGNDGGMGGDAFCASGLGSYIFFNGIPGNSPSNGAGLGGKGIAENASRGSTANPAAYPGGGGGGGYGGGGGRSMGEHYGYYSREYFTYSEPGKGGAGCVLIERVG